MAFDNYQPDPRYPSQLAARDRLRDVRGAASVSRRRAHLLQRLLKQLPERPQSIYLDGGYGVGKTHLLAATYHAVERPSAATCRLASWRTPSRAWACEPTLVAFADTRLLCIDEFELDDVAQTRMAATFLRRLLRATGLPIAVVTTSNTLPSDLGQGRFAAEAFQREIGEIAARFEVVSIDGEDYRHRHWDELPPTTSDVRTSRAARAYAADPAPETARVLLDWPSLAEQLEAVHPVHYAQIATRLDALLSGGPASAIDDQAVALRLVHFVDKLYDQEVRLTLTTRDSCRWSRSLRRAIATAATRRSTAAV